MKRLIVILLLISMGNALTFPVDISNCIIKKGRVLLTGWFSEKRSYGKHKALDIPCYRNTPIRAVRSGTIIETGHAYPFYARQIKEWRSNYGNYIKLRDRFGYTWIYAHLESSSVAVGQTVTEGQVIAYAGSTGIVDTKGHVAIRAFHLHIECRDEANRYINVTSDFGDVIKNQIPDTKSRYSFSLRRSQ